MKPLCIYHGKCADGFTSAWVVHTFFGEEVEFHPGIYGEEPPDVIGRDVLLVDFSYKRPVLEKMIEQANSLRVIDHHKTAQEDLAFLPRISFSDTDIPKTAAFFDMDRSGAGLTWDFFNPGATRPAIVNYVEDRDLWKFNLPSSRAINAFIFSYDYSFENWDVIANIIEHDPERAAAAGAAIERKHHKDVSELVEVCRRRIKVGGQEVWGASIPYTLTSDAGNLMAQGEPFAVCYWDTPKGRVFSLRSTKDGADVSAIASTYGGGGHKNASGFTVPLSRIAEFEL